MSNFVRPVTFEWVLGNQNPYEERTVLIAQLRHGVRGVGAYVSFGAEQRFTVVKPDAPEELRGVEARRALPTGPTFYARELGEEDSALAMLLEGVAAEQIIGRAAENAIWSAFWTLVLRDRRSNRWINQLGSDWLRELRDEARAQKTAA